MFGSSLVAKQVKDLPLSLQWLRSLLWLCLDPWPVGVAKKKMPFWFFIFWKNSIIENMLVKNRSGKFGCNVFALKKRKDFSNNLNHYKNTDITSQFSLSLFFFFFFFGLLSF